MAKRRNSKALKLPKARRVRRARDHRPTVTRAEYTAIVKTLNERNDILNALRDALQRIEQASDVQFRRIAQIQADLDDVKRAWEKLRL